MPSPTPNPSGSAPHGIPSTPEIYTHSPHSDHNESPGETDWKGFSLGSPMSGFSEDEKGLGADAMSITDSEYARRHTRTSMDSAETIDTTSAAISSLTVPPFGTTMSKTVSAPNTLRPPPVTHSRRYRRGSWTQTRMRMENADYELDPHETPEAAARRRSLASQAITNNNANQNNNNPIRPVATHNSVNSQALNRELSLLARLASAITSTQPAGPNVDAPLLPTTDWERGIIGWDGQDDPEMPLNWPARRKWRIIVCLAMITFMTPFASNILAPAIQYLQEEFHEPSTLRPSLPVMMFILGYAVGPLFLSPLSEMYGRHRILVAANLFFSVWNIGCALAPSLTALIIFRFLAGVGGSAPITIGGGVVADMFVFDERGFAMSIWTLGPLVGPIISPIAGAFIAQSIGWRYCCWVIFGPAVVISVIFMLSFRECYARVLIDRKVQRLRKELARPDLISCYDYMDGVHRHDRKEEKFRAKETKEKKRHYFPSLSDSSQKQDEAGLENGMNKVDRANPGKSKKQKNGQHTVTTRIFEEECEACIASGHGSCSCSSDTPAEKGQPAANSRRRPITIQSRGEIIRNGLVRPIKMLAFSPIVFSISLYIAVSYGMLYLLFNTVNVVFQERYGMSSGIASFSYLGIGLGYFLGILSFSTLSDRMLTRLIRENNGAFVPEMRLRFSLYFSLLLPVTFFWYGWSAYYSAHWIVPILGLAPFGTAILGISMPMQAYLIDAYPGYGASAMASLAVFRSLMAVFIPLLAPTIYDHLDLGWGNSLLGFITVALIPVPLLIYRYGERLRTRKPLNL